MDLSRKLNVLKKETLVTQLFEFTQPIPSLSLYSLKYNEGKWSYVYKILTPARLTDKKRKEPFYLVGNLENAKFTASINENMVHIEVYCKEDVEKLFKEQRKADLFFRKHFKEELSEEELKSLKENTFTLKNKGQKVKEGRRIVRVKSKDENSTTFVGI